MNNPELVLALLAKRREFQVAADAITALVTALDTITPAVVVAEISGEVVPGALFPTPHSDPA